MAAEEMEIDDSEKEPVGGNKNIITHSNQSALAFYLELSMTTRSYTALRRDLTSRNCPIFPPYKSVKEEMKKCLSETVIISETKAYASLQDVVNLVAKRACEAHASSWEVASLKYLRLVATTGFDGAGGHGNPQQKYKNPANKNNDPEQTLLTTGLVLVQLE